MPIEVKVVPTRKKRIRVVRIPADWQQYIEIEFVPNEKVSRT